MCFNSGAKSKQLHGEQATLYWIKGLEGFRYEQIAVTDNMVSLPPRGMCAIGALQTLVWQA
jgi:hypothetical protein